MLIRYSMIDSFIRCPKGFHNDYILGLKTETKSSALEFGTAIHAALRAHFEGNDPYIVFNMYWESIKDQEVKYDRFEWSDLYKLGNTKFIPNFIKFHAKKFGPAKIEEELSAPLLDGHELQGTYDLCGEYNNSLTMVDWKTSMNEYKVSRIFRNPQLYIYSYLYKAKYGILPSGIMYKVFVKTKGSIQTIYAPLTEEKLSLQMDNVKAIVENMSYMIANNKLYSNYNCYCERCFKW